MLGGLEESNDFQENDAKAIIGHHAADHQPELGRSIDMILATAMITFWSDRLKSTRAKIVDLSPPLSLYVSIAGK